MPRIFLFLIFLTSCTGSQRSQDGGDLMRSEVEFLATRMELAVERQYPLLKHKNVNQYVDSLGQRIISHNPDLPPLPYEFRMLKANEVLAFSLPGGVHYFSLGLLRLVDLEGQLAGAISHELAHQQLGHQLIKWRRKVNAHRGEKYIVDFSGNWEDEFLGKDGALYLDPAMEEEADKLALVILYRAKFDPRSYLSFLELLQKQENSKSLRKNVIDLMELHPPIASRLKWVKEGLASLPPMKDPILSSQSFTGLKQKLLEAEKASKKERNEGHGRNSK